MASRLASRHALPVDSDFKPVQRPTTRRRFGVLQDARDEQDKDKNWHVVERSYGSFSERSLCRLILTRRRGEV
jgi:hypothetical protein